MIINRILIASDHAGFALKQDLIKKLNKDMENHKPAKLTIEDLGADSEERVDYPDFAQSLCKRLLKLNDPKTFGILICGSGQGMAMAANRFKGIRAALCWSEDVAILAREHNNANILCLSSRGVSRQKNYKIIKAFISTTFQGGRHKARIEKF